MNKYTRLLEIAPGAAPGPARGKGGPASGSPSHLGSRATSGWQPQAGPAAGGGLQGRGEAGVRVCPEVQDRGTGMEPKGAGQRDTAVPKGEGQRERTVVRCAGQKDRDSAKRCETEGQSRAQRFRTEGHPKRCRTEGQGRAQSSRTEDRDQRCGTGQGQPREMQDRGTEPCPRGSGQRDSSVPAAGTSPSPSPSHEPVAAPSRLPLAPGARARAPPAPGLSGRPPPSAAAFLRRGASAPSNRGRAGL